jgi:replicative DNA helicase
MADLLETLRPHDPDQVLQNLEPMSSPEDSLPPLLDIDAAMAAFTARRDGTVRPVPLPWRALRDDLSGGFWPGTLSLLIGDTGAGKTQWALQVALEAAANQHRVLYIALEADGPELIARCAAIREPRLYWSAILRGTHTPDPETLAHLRGLPFHAIHPEPRAASWDTLAGNIHKIAEADAEGPTPLVVLDFLQLCTGNGDQTRGDLRERIGSLVYGLKHAAREHSLAVLALSATSRGNYNAGEKDPALGEGNPARFVSWAKESGESEYAADAVLVLLRGSNELNDPTFHVALAKHRTGRPNWHKLFFDGRTFTDQIRRETPAPDSFQVTPRDTKRSKRRTNR